MRVSMAACEHKRSSCDKEKCYEDVEREHMNRCRLEFAEVDKNRLWFRYSNLPICQSADTFRVIDQVVERGRCRLKSAECWWRGQELVC